MKYFKVFALLPVLVALSVIFLPGIWVSILCLVDFHTSWVLFESPWYRMYHDFLISTLPDRDEIPLQELSGDNVDAAALIRASKGFTEPVVIRGLLANSTAVEKWWDKNWWLENYGEEEVLCGTLEHVVEDCTIGSFFENRENGTPFYISGASQIFKERPELHDMVDSEQLRKLAADSGLSRIVTQVFMGFPKMGSDIHAAQGINIFRMIVGQKKWWFIPTHQTPFLIPSINANAFSAHTNTKVGKGEEVESPWMKKLIRYTAVLSPGDVLVNPPWYWHGILNLGSEENHDLVIGTPTRYKGESQFKAAFKNNIMFTAHFVAIMFHRYGPDLLKPGFSFNMEAAIKDNRRSRENKEVETNHLEGSEMVHSTS